MEVNAYKVGDKMGVYHKGHPIDGEIVVITHVLVDAPRPMPYYLVHLESDVSRGFQFGHEELVPLVEPFNPWDEVLVWAGMVREQRGRVVDVDYKRPYGSRYMVNIGGSKNPWYFSPDQLKLVPPAPKFVKGRYYRVIREYTDSGEDRYFNQMGELVAIDERNEHPYTLFFGGSLGFYEEDYARYSADQLAPWVATAEDVEAFKAAYLKREFQPCRADSVIVGYEAFTTELQAFFVHCVARSEALARRKRALKGKLPYIRIGETFLRADAITVVEASVESGVWVTDFTMAGSPDYTDNRGILFLGEDAKRLRSWLLAQCYDLADEDYVDGGAE